MLEIYKKQIEFAFDCSQISYHKHNSIMEQSKKANGSLIRKMIKKQYPTFYEELALNFPNPYESQSRRTDKYLIYYHSAIEYFFEIQ